MNLKRLHNPYIFYFKDDKIYLFLLYDNYNYLYLSIHLLNKKELINYYYFIYFFSDYDDQP